MRCWNTPTGNHLVESPKIHRRTGYDPTPHSEARLLLRAAKAWLAQNARGARISISNLLRYYEVDQVGAVVNFYEEYSYSDEDDLHSWGYHVIGDQLLEFWLVHWYDEHKLRVKAVISDLEQTELPVGFMIDGRLL
jgi:hypothetical protein